MGHKPKLIFSTNSKFKEVWEVIIILLALVISLILPFSISIKPPFSFTTSYQVCLLMIDFIFFIDMIFTFRSETFDLMTGEEVNDPTQLAKNYAFSISFILDICSCLPWDQFGSSEAFQLLGLFKIIRVFRVGSII